MSPPFLLVLTLAAFSAAPLPSAAQDATQPRSTPSAAEAEPAATVSPSTATARYRLDAGDLDAALDALKDALRADPFDRDALLLLAEVLLARFDAAGAEATLRRALEANAPREQVLPMLAKALVLQGRAAEVLDELKPTVGMDSASRARLLAQRAAAQMAVGDLDRAAALLEQALAASPQVPEPWLARAALAVVRGDAGAARADLDAAIAQVPLDDEPWLMLAQLALELHDRAAAEAAYGEAMARAPVHWRSAHARALLRLGSGDLAGVAADLAAVEAQFPRFSGLVYARARLDLLRGRPAEAARGLERYLSTRADDPNALFDAALAAGQLGNREQARDYLERLRVVEGASARLLGLEAQMRLAAGDPDGTWALLQQALAEDAPSPQLVLTAEAALVQAGRIEEALALVSRARAARPGSHALLGAEARLRLGSGDELRAEALAAELAERDPESLDALLVRAELALRRGAADEVLLVAVKHARLRAPRDIRLAVVLGALHSALGDTDAACRALADALRLDPGAEEILARLRSAGCPTATPQLLRAVQSELMATQPQASRALADLLAGDAGPTPIAGDPVRLQAALDADPADAQLRANLVLTLLQRGQTDEAATVLGGTPPEPRTAPAILRVAGLLALARDEADEAMRAFRLLADARPDVAEPAYLLADAAARSGDLYGARGQFMQALRQHPEHPLARVVGARMLTAAPTPAARLRLIDEIERLDIDALWLQALRIQTLLDADRPAEAASLLRGLHQARPDDPRLLARLLLAMAAAGQLDEARTLGERWAADRAESAAHRAQGTDAGVALLLGDLNARGADPQRAVHWYEQVLAQAPEHRQALNNLAVLLTETDPDRAVALARRALAQAPEDADVLDSLGMALLAGGDSREAREHLRRAYARSPQRPDIALHLAQALLADGDPTRAREVLLPLVDRDFPQQVEARALLKRLGTD